MPYVSPSSPVNHTYEPSDFILRMRPSYEEAIIDIVRHYKWIRVFYVYDNDEGKGFILVQVLQVSVIVARTALQNCKLVMSQIFS